MVLWHMVESWRERLSLKITVAHVHHGESGSSQQLEYRDQARSLVKKCAEERGTPWVSNDLQAKAPRGEGEEPLREFRHFWLEKWRLEVGADRLVFAHHRRDQLETRLIRLIRGCSSEGLRAMGMVDGEKLRPLLAFELSDLQSYANEMRLSFLPDPSNEDLQPLRNWLRREWLPRLEAYRPGALRALDRSLDGIVHDLAEGGEPTSVDPLKSDYLSLPEYRTLSDREQQRQIALYLQKVGCRKFSQGQVKEIQKRLLTSGRQGAFWVAGCEWQINAEQVRAIPRS